MTSRSILLATLCWAAVASAAVPDASVVKVRAVAANGEVSWGSAIVIAPLRAATACHVTRHATMIEIVHGATRWVARAQEGDAVHDLCVLTVEGLPLPAVQLRPTQTLEPGERVTAAGFEHGGTSLVLRGGTVKGLYRYDGGMMIRTSAAFDFGSSGGGLFDEAGNLVGLLAFRARTGRDLCFALPSEWLHANSVVAAKFVSIDAESPKLAFWEYSATDRPAFLGVALRDSRESP